MRNKNHNSSFIIHNSRKDRGFSLLEMIVALGLFSVVILIGIGALTNMSAAAQKSKSTRITMDNLDFALENMMRSIRVGIDYHCGTVGTITEPANCPLGSDFFAFKNSFGQTVIFRLNNDSIQRSIDGGANYLDITAPEITIETLQFFVLGAPANDFLQPKVLMIIRGTAGTRELTKTTFDIQTTVSQRIFDS